MSTKNQGFQKINVLLGIAWCVGLFGGVLALFGLGAKLAHETTPPYAAYCVVIGMIIFTAAWIFSYYIRKKG